MKKFILLTIAIFTVATTTQADDTLDKVIKILEDIKTSKEVIVSDTKDVVASIDSLKNEYLNDSTVLIKTYKKIVTLNK